ncbi:MULTISPECIES: sugar O-acetyltransferase [Pseudomonas syringae group genomosp. 2]|uniref:Acetyltransferase n=2 Tax=Pseudomonas amygdali pv. mori TaxID=34065 RepID=A0A0N8S4Y5_PSEA0|nr:MULTISPECIES: sugar O-acetyltransferase [Pseudomonas syringae group genomosp. 2]EGH23500.1 galactoside-O-acetyltransferase [Pseudomonas amygdali pv. mori str. 301020]KPX32214.1 Galactoside-O-acetyltransferase [Pseudomonas ficuserectae]KPX91687.1 Galactoside-O-acetyltransferase [Pseudomonas amygdali pv. mori]QXW42872.1 sugar O-acetyltransferase [Pseudomonas amygdali]RMQ36770.1 hypothetical protein ALQ05_200327 [Pseudomonas amygdali pv. mori]
MNEIEKAAAGLLYNANYDVELLKQRRDTKEHLFELNSTRPSDTEKRHRLIKSIFGKIGEGFTIEGPFSCDYGYNIEAGINFYANTNLVILDGAKVTFGDNVFIAPNVGIYTAGHPLDFERRNEGLEYAYPILIGSNVWIGAGVSILPGVTVGDNTVIGSGSIVTKSLPPDVIAAGNPCKVLRPITDADRKAF